MLKAIIFDFDGVILESVDIKTEAFRKLFKNYPEHLGRILDYHMTNGGISRFVKFKVIYEDILKKKLTEEESKRLGEKFAEYSYELVLKAPFVKGAEEFLTKYHKKLDLFVISGTPQDEMLSIVKDRKLGKYFKEVFGAPRTKGDLAKLILREHSLSPKEVIFVGDSITDHEGAQKASINFVGRVAEGKVNSFPPSVKAPCIIKDLDQLDGLIQMKHFK